jgi:membrane associated rhomboid family serine protease
VSAIALHGGIWHILPNLFIQLRVGGYLNLVFGTPMFFLIYFISGTVGVVDNLVYDHAHVQGYLGICAVQYFLRIRSELEQAGLY